MKKYYIIAAILILVIFVLSGVFLCCNTFKPIWNDQLPAECNMCLNVYKMYYKTEDKSAIVPMTEACVKKLHRDNCQAEVFGVNEKGEPNPVIYDDAKLYRNYTQCLSELK
jgi:hypothetical protein